MGMNKKQLQDSMINRKQIYNSLKEKAKTNEDVKQCIEIIDFIEDQRYKLWSENLDLKEKMKQPEKYANPS